MLVLDQIEKKYGKQTVLYPLSLSIQKGDIIGIMGESGSGKSTLAKIMCGIEKQTSGKVFLNNEVYTLKNRASIHLVFQDALQSVHSKWTIERILQEAQFTVIKKEIIQQILQDVGLNQSVLNKYPRQLSGGQLQRVCIARAILAKPDMIIFDEALSGLDPIIQGQLLELLHRLKQQHDLTYVFIAHDFKLCYSLCHKVLVMDNGKIIEEITDFTLPIKVKNEKVRALLRL